MGRLDLTWHGLFYLLATVMIAGCGGLRYPATTAGLRPDYPEVLVGYYGQAEFAEVDSLQPTLRWEVFPGLPSGGSVRKGPVSRTQHVTYDLTIWHAESDFRAMLVYARHGLPSPSHTIEPPLQQCTPYLWTIRARFELDGQTRVGEWGVIVPTAEELQRLGVSRHGFTQVEPKDIARRLPRVPNPFWYRFKTPCPKQGSSNVGDVPVWLSKNF